MDTTPNYWHQVFPVKGTVNTTVYKGIFDNCALTTYGKSFWKAPFCSSITMQKARSIPTWFYEFAAEELEWPAQSSNFNPTEHFWDEWECWIWVRSSCPKSVPDLTNKYLTEWAQNYGKPFQRKGVCFIHKERFNSIVMPMIWQCPISSYRYDGQESTNFWQYSVLLA